MKGFVCIALAVFLGIVAVEGYGPSIHRQRIGGPPFHRGPPHGPPHGPHRGPPHRLPPPHHGFGPHRSPPNQNGRWDDSPVWDDGPDSDSNGERNSFGSSSSGSDDSGPYGSGPDSSGPDGSGPDSSGPDGSGYEGYDSISREKGRPDDYDSFEDSRDWPHTKRPCTKKPTTHRPIPTKKPKPTRPTPKPTRRTPKPTRPTPKPTPPTPKPTPPKPITPKPTTPEPTTPEPTTPEPIPETTPTLPETTTNGGGVTTMSPHIAKCIKLCASTPEYNPVCGSDGKTYNNEGKLFCAKSCGVDVTLRRRSACPPPRPDDGGLTTSTLPSTTIATTPNIGRTTPSSDFTKCMKLCRITPTFAPVCGSDLVTYMNMDRLRCAQSCGEVLHVLCEKPCAACGFNPVTTTLRPITTSSRPGTTPQGRSTPDPDLQECIKGCPVTSEYNPVCGTNGVTYDNPGRLLCAQMCGDGVAVSRIGRCRPPSTTSTTTEATTTTLSPEIMSCIRRCPITPEHEPVCGTNDITYSNIGKLYCARFCGVDVDVKHKTRCMDEFDLDLDGTDSTSPQTTVDINGSKDRVTTAATTPITTSTVIPPITTSKVTTEPGPNSSSTLGFTIPDEILKELFGSTTPAPIPKTANPDSDEDLDLDPRYNGGHPAEESS